jgi:hypothetical protein
MSGKWKSWAAGGVVGGMLIYMGPDAVRDFASRSRQTVTPVFEEGVGAAGDGVNAIRKEANRQGDQPGRRVQLNANDRARQRPSAGIRFAG